jgi:hypothetical protein
MSGVLNLGRSRPPPAFSVQTLSHWICNQITVVAGLPDIGHISFAGNVPSRIIARICWIVLSGMGDSPADDRNDERVGISTRRPHWHSSDAPACVA